MSDRKETQSTDKESVYRTLLVSLFVSLACSAVVASAAVLLKPRQDANQALNMKRNILEVAGILTPDGEVDELFKQIETRIIEFESGNYVTSIDPDEFDPLRAARDVEQSVAIPSNIDQARVVRRARWGPVYLLRQGSSVSRIILPVRGYGLWSTMYGLIALEADANTIAAITFYEHAETPGLGDQVADPEWRALFEGKKVFGEEGAVRVEVVKGSVPDKDALAAHRVDGITGATLTGNGVTRLLRYWLGTHGYGPFLNRIRQAGGSS